jgi:hypothetical protein
MSQDVQQVNAQLHGWMCTSLKGELMDVQVDVWMVCWMHGYGDTRMDGVDRLLHQWVLGYVNV